VDGETSGDVPRLDDRRVLVVGASSGIGRAVGVAASRAGARVALAARRFDQLREVQREAGPRSWSVQLDVRSPIASQLAVRAATQELGGLDTVVYATGVNRLAMLVDTDLDAWHELLTTNLVGAALVTQAALPALRESNGRIAYLSSHSVARPWPALGAYAASKAGLDAMVSAWRTEVDDVKFTRVVVGPTVTGMADAWDATLAGAMFERWHEEGYLDIEPVPPEHVAEQLVRWAAMDEPPDDLSLVGDD
jgi:NAD(P)-dependent dehydrogenase (short-subunit alcohol dehydrogenase family)